MARNVLLIQGHPDPAGGHLCHALAKAYTEGASEAGHQVRIIEVGTLPLGYIRTQAEWQGPAADPVIQAAQEALLWSQHLVLIFPLWLGDMPAMLKSFLEHLSCGGFVMEKDSRGRWRPRLKGRSARVVVTMGMPAWIYRWYYAAHAVRALERNVLRFSGLAPVQTTFLGMVEGPRRSRARERWLRRLRDLGAQAA